MTGRFATISASLGAAVCIGAGGPAAATTTYEAQLSSPAAEEAQVCFRFAAGASQARTTTVELGASIQAAIQAAQPGDLISVGPGVFNEDIDFLGKAVHVVGTGAQTVIEGTGTGPVVTFASGESFDSVLDSVEIRGGRAAQGGGIYISNSSPTVIRTVITENRAAQAGSGIYVEGASSARLYNNLITYNQNDGGDPHSVQIVGASPSIVNNTIARGDSNGILVSGAATPLILNNVIARNGAVVDGSRRGRGICDFSTIGSTIRYNDFYRNRVAALLRGGRDWRRIEDFQQNNPGSGVDGNVDGRPGHRWRPSGDPEKGDDADFAPAPGRRAHAVHGGDPDPACDNRDGTRNTIGFTGGPFAPGSSAIPGPGSCGLATP